MKDYLWLVFLLILLFLLLSPTAGGAAAQGGGTLAGSLINSLASGQANTILALQGRFVK